MKKYSLVCCLLITIILLCSCGLINPIPEQLKLSNGMKKLAEKTIDSFNDYSNAKKGKTAYLKSIQSIHEQKEDLYTPGDKNFGDVYINEFIDEVYIDSISDYADKKDIKKPVDDIKKVLDGTYNYKKEILSQLCEIDDLSFWLPKSWKKGKKMEGSSAYSHTSKKGDTILLLPATDTSEDSLTIEDDSGASIIAKNLGLDKTNLKYSDIIKTRKLNYFYIYTGVIKGKKEDSNVLVAFANKVNTGYSSIGYKNYYFVFFTDGKFEKSKIYNILDNVDNVDGETIYDVDDKYEEYFETH